uniref:MANSC domain-containing protein n=1 Tax=Stomoxys calcitrans TaxID=35570 RepID=A0A1I8PLI1_STOCA
MLDVANSPLAIVSLLLIANVQHMGTHATKEVVNFETLNDDKTHHLQKRMDLQICLGQFDVHKNTIIRTGESQAIGGKYLQGLELDTMEECQRLCCETESCDVYIFESKKDGYCYLFECGTPENFHCKFTRHANYTSAVLTPVIRHGLDITTPHPLVAHKSSSGISQQEWELSNLKLKPDIREKNGELGLINAMPSNGSTKKSLGTDIAQEAKVNASAQCGRFQFSCHSGECIAIYNACDGIPQCEDGSDEGPECSGANSNLTPASKSSSDTPSSLNSKTASVSSSLSQYQPSLMQQSAQQQLQNMQQTSHQAATAGAVAPIPVVNNREDPTVWETRKIVSGTPIGVGGSNGGNPDLQNMNALPQGVNVVGDGFTAFVNNRQPGSNVIYTPAGSSADINGGVGNNVASTLEQSGLYIPHADQQNSVYAQQHILLPPPPPPPPAPINSNWQQQAILNQQKQQQQQQQQSLTMSQQQQQQLTLPQGPSYAMQPDGSVQQQPQQVPSVMMQQQQQQSAQLPVPSLPQQQQQPIQLTGDSKSSSPTGVLNPSSLAKNALKMDDSDEYDDSEEKSTEPPKKHKHKKAKSKSKDLQKTSDANDETHVSQLQQLQQQGSASLKTSSSSSKAAKPAASPVHEQYEIIHQNMALEFRDHDGQSERPGGAVLSLTLGLLITAALAILIGCRMRTVGRRARRMGGKTPYSHEADFLVNGMYL